MIHFTVWVIVSGIAAFLASRIINKNGSGVLADMVLGIIGGFACGFILYEIPFLEGLGGHTGFTGIAVEVIVAIIGAMLVTWLYERAVALE